MTEFMFKEELKGHQNENYYCINNTHLTELYS